MRVTVLLFASVADADGSRAFDVDTPARTTVESLRRRLEAERPRLAGKLGRCAAAVNAALAGPDRALEDGDEVAFLPPVSGG
jgi:molybdopterin synthase sulfur carrier subunit